MQFSQFVPALPFSGQRVSEVFKVFHFRHTDQYVHWSLSASRRKIVAHFWLETLISHFLPLWMWGIIILLLFSSAASMYSVFLVSFPTGIFVYMGLLLTLYLPVYHLDFLPQLDNCLEQYKNEQLEGIQKCKKEQHPVLTLLLIQTVYQKLAGINSQAISEPYMKTLVKQYGVSSKSIDSCLRIIILKQWDRKKERKRTEINDAFEEAKDHFVSLEFDKAIPILEDLQRKVLT